MGLLRVLRVGGFGLNVVDWYFVCLWLCVNSVDFCFSFFVCCYMYLYLVELCLVALYCCGFCGFVVGGYLGFACGSVGWCVIWLVICCC